MNSGESGRAQRVLLRMAASIAARGWHVFPCVPGGKHPALRGSWLTLATTDPARIGRWWHRVPYNIGIACGPSGLVVIDTDIPAHGRPQDGAPKTTLTGLEELARLCREHSQPFPVETFTVRTPSGGFHLYFEAPGQHAPGNSAGRLGPLIDVRADGGYVLAPGSQYGGRLYTITNPALPAPLPGWIAELAHGPDSPDPADAAVRGPVAHGTAYAEAALRAESAMVAAAAVKTRNDTLNKAAFNLGQLVAAGQLSADDVVTELTRAAETVGLEPGEIPRTIRSGMTAGLRSPRRRDVSRRRTQ